MKHEYQRLLFIECHGGWLYWWQTLMFINQEQPEIKNLKDKFLH